MKQITITFDNNMKEKFNNPVKVIDVLNFYYEKTKKNIVGLSIDNVIKNSNDKIKKDCHVEFITTSNVYGNKMYQNGLKFVLLVSAYELFNEHVKVEFQHSLDKGIFTKIRKKPKFSVEDLEMLKKQMKQNIKKGYQIQRIIADKKQAISYFDSFNEHEKSLNLKNLSSSTVTLYKLKDYYNYFYVDLPFNTKVLNNFDLVSLDDESFVLTFPTVKSNDKVLEYIHRPATLNSFIDLRKWLKSQHSLYVSDLNKYVQNASIDEFILSNEIKALHDLYKITDDIISKKSQIVLLSGPSSSGKTTTAKRLALVLKSRGISSLLISTDDYFKNKVDTPKDKNGNYEFEGLDALDLDLFQKNMKKLINKEAIYPPKYNFISGVKEFSDKSITLKDNEIIIIEGLHSLNEKILNNIENDKKYKIYVSPFVALNLDRHNHISSLDLRLIRRIVRDYATRGSNVEESLKSWDKVRSEEAVNIYDFQNQADCIINTSLAYELGVLKVFAEPLLQSVQVNSLYYEEAGRLINFLKSFCPITSENVPSFSILREFIGRSIFK